MLACYLKGVKYWYKLILNMFFSLINFIGFTSLLEKEQKQR